MALGADACYIGTAALIALNCNKPIYDDDYRALGTAPHSCHHCHTGRCPVGITTQDPELMKRLDIEQGAERVRNLLRAMTLEIQMLARSCGKVRCASPGAGGYGGAVDGGVGHLRHSARRAPERCSGK